MLARMRNMTPSVPVEVTLSGSLGFELLGVSRFKKLWNCRAIRVRIPLVQSFIWLEGNILTVRY